MTINLNHPFVSLKTDGSDTSVVRPSDWNADHNAFFTATSGTQRTLDSKIQETVSVKDFGAVGTASTDDTAAINAAIAAVAAKGGGFVYFPIGLYFVTSPLLITDNYITLIGEGGPYGDTASGTQFASTIKWGGVFNATARCVRFGDGTKLLVGGGIRNMRVDGGVLCGHSALQLDTVQWAAFENVGIYNACPNAYALRLDSADITAPNNCGVNQFKHCQILGTGPGCSGLGIVIEDTPTGLNERAASRNSFVYCDIFAAGDVGTSYGIHLGHCDSNIFTLVDVALGGAPGIALQYSQSATRPEFPAGNVFVHCFLEAVTLTNCFGGTPGNAANAPNLFVGWDEQLPIPSMQNTIITDAGNIFRSGLPATPGAFHCVSGGNYALLDTNTVQPWFPVTGGQGASQVTLIGSTTYFFEGTLMINAGAVVHTTAVSFGGTATINVIDYDAEIYSAGAPGIQTTNMRKIFITSAVSTALNAPTADAFVVIKVKGVMRITNGGTLIPQFTFSAAPGTPTVERDSYFLITPVGTNNVFAFGPWS